MGTGDQPYVLVVSLSRSLSPTPLSRVPVYQADIQKGNIPFALTYFDP